jgi:tetratricopeptide (TPR) repeat protein
VQAFFKATRISPEQASIWFNLGMSYYQNKQYDEALISFLEAHRLKAEEKYLYHACLSYFKAGEIHQSIQHLRTLLANNDKHGHAWKLLAQSYEHLEQFPEAKSAYQKAYLHLPEDGEIIYALDKLIEHQEKNLDMPNAYDAEVTSVTPTSENFTVELPMSRLIDVTAPEYVAPTQTGLIPLSQSYHLSFDAPHQHNFKPSEEKNWNPRSEPESTPRPAKKVKKQPPARTSEDL